MQNSQSPPSCFFLLFYRGCGGSGASFWPPSLGSTRVRCWMPSHRFTRLPGNGCPTTCQVPTVSINGCRFSEPVGLGPATRKRPTESPALGKHHLKSKCSLVQWVGTAHPLSSQTVPCYVHHRRLGQVDCMEWPNKRGPTSQIPYGSSANPTTRGV